MTGSTEGLVDVTIRNVPVARLADPHVQEMFERLGAAMADGGPSPDVTDAPEPAVARAALHDEDVDLTDDQIAQWIRRIPYYSSGRAAVRVISEMVTANGEALGPGLRAVLEERAKISGTPGSLGALMRSARRGAEKAGVPVPYRREWLPGGVARYTMPRKVAERIVAATDERGRLHGEQPPAD